MYAQLRKYLAMVLATALLVACDLSLSETLTEANKLNGQDSSENSDNDGNDTDPNNSDNPDPNNGDNPDPNSGDNPDPNNAIQWQSCANENKTCSFKGTTNVRYGAGDQWNTLTITGSTLCANSIFGDPAPGQVKTCQVASTVEITDPDNSDTTTPETLPIAPNCLEINAVDFDRYTGITGFTDAATDTKAGMQILQIAERDQTAAAQETYQGLSAQVLFKLHTMQEHDGEPTYRVKVNDTLIGSATNSRIDGVTIADYSMAEHLINTQLIQLNSNDIIQVEFSNHSNGLVPEGDTGLTATARGRWKSLEICSPSLLSATPAVEPESPNPSDGNCSVAGELNKFQRVELICKGLAADELDQKTFTDYRFNVEFTKGAQKFLVPGHFAADGDAANSSATSGDKWRAYFMPPTTGEWTYKILFRTGTNIAVKTEANAGTAVAPFNGKTGTFDVAGVTAVKPDMRARGKLQTINGERYMRFSHDNTQFVSAGMDSPENIFGFHEFDNTTKYSNVSSCKGILHEFEPHLADWKTGDPTWQNGKGKALIGLINYIGSRGVNAIYMMGMTVNSDGCDAHPWTTYNADGSEKSFDVSKLDQWEIAIRHMERKGIMLHYMTQEQENDQLLNNGDLGLERKLYYREIISRFAHHPALQWNLGEENTNTPAQQKAFADYIKQTDPYNHAIVMHTYPWEHYRYDDLYGHSTVNGATIQTHNILEVDNPNAEKVQGRYTVYTLTKNMLKKAKDAGQTWLVTHTEASGKDAPRPNQEVSKLQRVYYMWASVMSGGAGYEWYVKGPVDGAGSVHAYDLAVENLREFDHYWQQSGYLSYFFEDIVQIEQGIDLNDLTIQNSLTNVTTDWVLADAGEAYIIYLREGGTANLTLPDTNMYDRLWFNPRTGETFEKTAIQGVGATSVGYPPSENSQDWAVLITLSDDQDGIEDNSGDYVEKDGVVIMEAENTKSPLGKWEVRTTTPGYTGTGHLYFTGNSFISGPADSPLEYTFKINTAGTYRLEMRVARENVYAEKDGVLQDRTDVANDGFVRVEGDYTSGGTTPLNTLKTDTKYFGGGNNKFQWATGNRLDRDHEKWPAIYNFKAGKTYTLTLSGRSQRFRVDRIIFRNIDIETATAHNLANAETR